MRLDFGDDDAGPRFDPRLAQGSAHFIGSCHLPDPCSHAFGIAGEVDAQILPFQTLASRIPRAELIAEFLPGTVHLQSPDRLIPVVFPNHHRKFQVLLHGGDQFDGIHQIGAIPQIDDNLPFRPGETDPEAGGQFMPHTGVAEFQMVLIAPADRSHLVQSH